MKQEKVEKKYIRLYNTSKSFIRNVESVILHFKYDKVGIRLEKNTLDFTKLQITL